MKPSRLNLERRLQTYRRKRPGRFQGRLTRSDSLDSEIKPLSEPIEALVGDDTQAQLLCTIPGIGRYSALLILAEIGE